MIPVTSCSGAYPELVNFFKCCTSTGTHGTYWGIRSGSCWQRSVTSVNPQSSTPWFLRSCSSGLVLLTKCSWRSGTLRMMRIVQRAAFFWMYGFAVERSPSTSWNRSRAIS